MATSPATGPRSTRGNRPHARLINSLCTPGPMSRAQETTAALHTAGCHNHPPRVVGSSILSSSHPGQAPPDSLQALPDSLAVSFKNPGLVCAWDLIAENSAPVPSFQVSRAVQKFGLPYLVTEIKYWRQKLDFLIHQWLKIVKFLSSRCYISQEELRYALGVHQNRIAVLKMLISALYHMGQEAVKSPPGAFIPDNVERLLNSWNLYRPEILDSAFKHICDPSYVSKLAGIPAKIHSGM